MRTSVVARFTYSVAVAVMCSGVMVAAQRGQGSPRKAPPTGQEIAAAARAATLDPANAGTATMFGKPFKLTPVRGGDGAPNPESGAFVGVLENGAAGDETTLPAGKHNLFVAQVNGQWKGYAESGGTVHEAIRATVTPGGGSSKPTFSAKGWCALLTYRFAPNVTVTIRVCF